MDGWFEYGKEPWRELADAHRVHCLAVVESVDEAKFTQRGLTREQYKAACSLARDLGWSGMPEPLTAHLTEVRDWRTFKYLPENLQYCAVSQRYQEHMTERINWHHGYENVISDLMRDYYADQWASISRVW